VAFKRAGTRSSDDEAKVPARSLSPERLEQRARNVVLYQLNRTIKSRKQLADILERREIPTEIAEAVLERFTEAGLIDDRRFAETLVATRRSARGLSRSALARELSTKGVSPEIIDEVLSELTTEEDLATATKLAVKRIRGLMSHPRETRNRRLLGFLQRKGYSASIAFAAIKTAENEAVKSEF
jgi:regulatory protein